MNAPRRSRPRAVALAVPMDHRIGVFEILAALVTTIVAGFLGALR